MTRKRGIGSGTRQEVISRLRDHFITFRRECGKANLFPISYRAYVSHNLSSGRRALEGAPLAPRGSYDPREEYKGARHPPPRFNPQALTNARVALFAAADRYQVHVYQCLTNMEALINAVNRGLGEGEEDLRSSDEERMPETPRGRAAATAGGDQRGASAAELFGAAPGPDLEEPPPHTPGTKRGRAPARGQAVADAPNRKLCRRTNCPHVRAAELHWLDADSMRSMLSHGEFTAEERQLVVEAIRKKDGLHPIHPWI